jgi:hypothetical protein
VAGLSLLGLIGISGLRHAYGDATVPRVLLVGGVGLLVGSAIALLGARRRWGPWRLLALVAAAFILIGAPLVVGDVATAGVLPGPAALDALWGGLSGGWGNLLTAVAPVGDVSELLVIPWTLGLACGALATTVSRRGGRFAVLALLAPIVVLVAGVLLGTDEPAWPLQVTVFAVVALIWGSWRQRAVRVGAVRGSAGRRWLGSIGLLVVASSLGLLIGGSSVVTGDRGRYVLRDEVDPPFDMRRFPSPLEGFRRYRVLQDDMPLFRVSGLREGDRIRLATLDAFDGVVWHVQSDDVGPDSSAYFRRVGSSVDPEPRGRQRTLSVEVLGYEGPWVPSIGDTTGVTFVGENATALREGFLYNLATDTAAVPTGLQSGDRYRLQARVAPEPDVERGDPDATTGAPDPFPVERLALEAQATLAASGLDPDRTTALERARAIESWLNRTAPKKDERCCFFSDGRREADGRAEEYPSRPGHGAERLRSMFDPSQRQVVGNEEQYASAMAVMAASIGLPARVVVGFAPEVDATGRAEITGRQVSAWVEVAVHDVGWVPLLPTPADPPPPQQTADELPPPDRIVPPPPQTTTTLPQQPPSGSGGGGTETPECRPDEWDAKFVCVPGWMVTAVRWLFPPVAVVAGATGLMALIKARRRTRRRTRGEPAARVAAGWAEVCDLARDLGDVVPDRATRREVAVILDRPGVADLARRADRTVFGPGAIDDEAVDKYWEQVTLTRAAMLGPLPWYERWKALVNPSSLRRRTERAPVRFGQRRVLDPSRLRPALR